MDQLTLILDLVAARVKRRELGQLTFARLGCPRIFGPFALFSPGFFSWFFLLLLSSLFGPPSFFPSRGCRFRSSAS